MNKPRRIGMIDVFGVGLVLSSLVHMQTLLVDMQWYFQTYNDSYMPSWLAQVRYSFSWLQRILGICAGFGLLSRRHWARVLALGIGVFTIVTVYWKHPYQPFYNHTQYLDQHWGSLLTASGTDLQFVDMVLPAMIAHIVLDIAFNGLMIYTFTRHSIKSQFL